MTDFLFIVSGFLAAIFFVAGLVFTIMVIALLPENELGRDLHRNHRWLYRLLTGLDEWRGDDDDDHLWRGGPPGFGS